MSIALVAMTIVATAGTAFAWNASALSPGDEQLLLSLTNQDRARAGLNALVEDTYLHKEAEWRAQDMGDNKYFGHQIPPTNNQVFSYMQADGYCFNTAGENIGYSTYPDDTVTTGIETAFMNSPGHRANILGTWARIGVGAYKAADGKKLYAVLFSIPCGVRVPVARVATPAPTRAAAPAPTLAPARKATAKPTAQPTAQLTATAAVTPSTPSTPSPTDLQTVAPSPTLPAPTPTATSSGSAATGDTSGAPISLRVYQNPVSRGLIDSLFGSVFGGLFGS